MEGGGGNDGRERNIPSGLRLDTRMWLWGTPWSSSLFGGRRSCGESRSAEIDLRIAPTTTSFQNHSDLCVQDGSIQLWRWWQRSPCLLDELLQVTLTEFSVQLLQLLSLGLGVQRTFRDEVTTFFSIYSMFPGLILYQIPKLPV